MTKKSGQSTTATKDQQKKAEKAPKVAKDTQNGITRPKAGTQTGEVWEIADALSAKAGEPIGRAEVLVETDKAKLNPATAATQYGRWRTYNGLKGKGIAKKPAKSKDKAA